MSVAFDVNAQGGDWNRRYVALGDQPRVASSPKCGHCQLPASWHVLKHTKTMAGLYCWDRARNVVTGAKTMAYTGNRMFNPPGGATEALEAYMGLRKTMELVSVDGVPLTLADMKRRVKRPTRTTVRKAKPTVVPTDTAPVTHDPTPSPAWDRAPKAGPTVLDGVPRYSSACVKCRYARPGDPGDHRNHVAKAAAKGTAKPAHTPTTDQVRAAVVEILRQVFDHMGWEITA